MFSFVPNISILNLYNSSNEITKSLKQFVAPYNGTVCTVKTDIAKAMKGKIKRASYDYAVVDNCILNSSDKKMLMKIVSIGLRDSGYIIILEKKR